MLFQTFSFSLLYSGLAWAICEHLVDETKAPTLFATHFHELTALAHANGHESNSSSRCGVANYHVGAHIDPSSRKLTMLYKVLSFIILDIGHWTLCNFVL